MGIKIYGIWKPIYSYTFLFTYIDADANYLVIQKEYWEFKYKQYWRMFNSQGSSVGKTHITLPSAKDSY